MPVEAGVQLVPGEEPGDVAREDLALEVRDRTGLRRRERRGVADDEDVRAGLGLQGVRVGRDEPELVPQPRRVLHIGRSAVQGHHDRQVEGDLPPVVGDQAFPGAVHLAGVELGHQLDVLLRQQPGQGPGGDGLGERAVQGGDISQLDLVADTAFGEEPVGEEAELERGDRALDRQVDHVHHEPSRGEPGQRGLQGHGPFVVVEGMHRVAPAGAGQPFGLLGHQARAGGDHQDVVGQRRAVLQVDLVTLGVHPVDGGAVVVDAVVQLPRAGSHEVFRSGEAEGHEQQPGLVDVVVVVVDDGDVHVVAQVTAQPVGRQRTAGAAAEDHDSLGHPASLRPRRRGE